MMKEMPLSEFEAEHFAAQIQRIEAAFAEEAPEESAIAILGEVLRSKDQALLQHALLLLARDLPQSKAGGLERALLSQLLAFSDVSFLGFLELAEGDGEKPYPNWPMLARLLEQAVWRLPLQRREAIGVCLRALKKGDPGRFSRLVNQAEAQVEEALQRGDRAVANLDERALCFLTGAALKRLCARENAAFLQKRAQFSRRMLSELWEAPKTIAQAQAERLLSQQIYTDKGHFISELLQNADDAHARFWQMSIDRTVEMPHDGDPLDMRDVLGLLQMGQTTKEGDAIGQFGVGFKAIYAVCDRPRVQCDVWAFEIADRSRPKPLPQSTFLKGAGTDLKTRIELPLKSGVSPKEIAEKAFGLPSAVLLTLPHLQEIAICFHGQTRHLRVQKSEEQAILYDQEKTYRLLMEREGDLFVAAEIDERERPKRLSQGLPQIFSFLPIASQPGFRFMIQGRFELPVDRERLIEDSLKNQMILEKAGQAFLRLARRMLQKSPEDCTALLELCPLPSELKPPYSAFLKGFLRDLESFAFIPNARGELFALQQVLFVSEPFASRFSTPVLKSLLRETPYPLQGEICGAFASERMRAFAKAFGGRNLTFDDALKILDALLQAQSDEAKAFLGENAGILLDLFCAFGALTDEAIQRELLARAFLPSADGGLYRAEDLYEAGPELKNFAILRPLMAPPLEAHLPLLRHLRLRRLRPEDVIADLTGGEKMRLFDALGYPRIWRFLQDLPPSLLEPLKSEPIFWDQQGRVGRLQGEDRLSLPIGPLQSALRSFDLPLVHQTLQRSFEPLLRSFNARIIPFDQLLNALEAQAEDFAGGAPDPKWEALHLALQAFLPEMTPRMRALLEKAAIYPCSDGRFLPLKGEGATAYRLIDPELLNALSGPFLPEPFSGFAHVKDSAAILDADELARALLTPHPLHQLLIQADFSTLAGWFEAHPVKSAVGGCDLEIWHGEGGVLIPLSKALPPHLSPLTPIEEEASAYLRDFSLAFPLCAEDFALAEALGLKLCPVISQFLQALQRATPKMAQDERLQGLLQAIFSDAESEERFSEAKMALIEAPIWKDEEGLFGSLEESCDLSDLLSGDRIARVDPLMRAFARRAGLRLIAEDHERERAKLFKRLPVAPLPLLTLCNLFEHSSKSPEMASLFLSGLLEGRRSHLYLPDAEERDRLSTLKLWPNRLGTLCRSEELLLGQSFFEAQIQAFEAELLDLEAKDRYAPILSWFHFASQSKHLLKQIELQARSGEPLSEQPLWMNSREKLLQLLTLMQDIDWETLGRMPLALGTLGELLPLLTPYSTKEVESLKLPLPLIERDFAESLIALGYPVKPLQPQRLLDLIDEHLLKKGEPENAPLLYAAIESLLETLDDPQRRRLCRMNLCKTPSGKMKPAEALLFTPLNDLELLRADWTAQGLPQKLSDFFLAQTAGLQEKKRPLLEKLLETHQDAAMAKDGELSQKLLQLFCSLTEGSDLKALAETLKLQKRIRIETSNLTAPFARPKDLLLVSDAAYAELCAFCDPPLRVSPRYAGMEALLLAAGCRTSLPSEQLQALLDAQAQNARSQKPDEDDDKPLLLSRALLKALAAEPALRQKLRLDQARWIPNAKNQLFAPGSLYAPGPILRALGMSEDLYCPAPAFWSAYVSLFEKTALPFLTDRDLPADLLVRQLSDQMPASDLQLQFLEQKLLQGEKPQALRSALLTKRVLKGKDGRCHSFETLFTALPEALQSGPFSLFESADRYPKLAQALQMTGEIPSEKLRMALESMAVFEKPSFGFDYRAFVSKPEAAAFADCAIDLLLKRGETLPQPFALPTVGGKTVTSSSDPKLYLPCSGLTEAALKSNPELSFPECRQSDASMVESLLMLRGVKEIASYWHPQTLLLGDLTDETPALLEMTKALTDMGLLCSDDPRSASDDSILMRLKRAYPKEDPQKLDATRILFVSAIAERGLLLKQKLERPLVLAVQDRTLYLTPEAASPERLSESILTFITSAPSADFAQVLTALLQCRKKEAMAVYLDAKGIPKTETQPIQKEAPQPKPSTEQVERLDRSLKMEIEPILKQKRDEGSLLKKLFSWIQGDEPKPESTAVSLNETPKPSEEPSPEFDRNWFKPQEDVGPQQESNKRWVEDRDRASNYGVVFSPSRLPRPYLYAPMTVVSHYMPALELWVPQKLDPSWFKPKAQGRSLVRCTARLDPGLNQLPMPLYSALSHIEIIGSAQKLEGQAGQILLKSRSDIEVHYDLSLCDLPEFESAVPATCEEMIQKTVPDSELPEECLDLVQSVLELPAMERALQIEAFIRQNYVYDPSYLEDDALARALKKRASRAKNPQIAMLHAGRDKKHLGRGVCRELNALCCELIRRSGIACAVSTGWLFADGSIGQADHFFALALFETRQGKRFFPIDASTTAEGRPLHPRQRPLNLKSPRTSSQQFLPKEPEWLTSKKLPQKQPIRELMVLMRQTGAASGLNDTELRKRCAMLLNQLEFNDALNTWLKR